MAELPVVPLSKIAEEWGLTEATLKEWAQNPDIRFPAKRVNKYNWFVRLADLDQWGKFGDVHTKPGTVAGAGESSGGKANSVLRSNSRGGGKPKGEVHPLDRKPGG